MRQMPFGELDKSLSVWFALGEPRLEAGDRWPPRSPPLEPSSGERSRLSLPVGIPSPWIRTGAWTRQKERPLIQPSPGDLPPSGAMKQGPHGQWVCREVSIFALRECSGAARI